MGRKKDSVTVKVFEYEIYIRTVYKIIRAVQFTSEYIQLLLFLNKNK